MAPKKEASISFNYFSNLDAFGCLQPCPHFLCSLILRSSNRRSQHLQLVETLFLANKGTHDFNDLDVVKSKRIC